MGSGVDAVRLRQPTVAQAGRATPGTVRRAIDQSWAILNSELVEADLLFDNR